MFFEQILGLAQAKDKFTVRHQTENFKKNFSGTYEEALIKNGGINNRSKPTIKIKYLEHSNKI
ncbi:hypothetical protein [Paenibacillus sp. GP183]|uniref:hypothetical protein n=1 Tax=Paenibacillus sp. GP183 TaxID=1882751 RepID=UPI000B896E6E|nr:hypothetical protein [Paenibacillus sp. GP183]